MCHTENELTAEEAERSHNITWSGFNTSLIDIIKERWICFVSIVPRIFQVCCHDQAWVRYYQNSWLSKQRPITCYCIDQSLYALIKLVQWNWKGNYGVKSFAIMMGPLDIEMAALKAIKVWLKVSGWSSALSKTDIESSGAADSFLHAAHATKTRSVNINIFLKIEYFLRFQTWQCFSNCLHWFSLRFHLNFRSLLLLYTFWWKSFMRLHH